MKKIFFLSTFALFVTGFTANAPLALADSPDNKVAVCHVPPGNPGNAHTTVVGESAVPAHLDHGDYLGECNFLPLPQ